MVFVVFFFFKQKTAYELRISDWSSDVCSSGLPHAGNMAQPFVGQQPQPRGIFALRRDAADQIGFAVGEEGGQDCQTHPRMHPRKQARTAVILHDHRLLEPILPEPRLIRLPHRTPATDERVGRELFAAVGNTVTVGIVAAAIERPRIVGDRSEENTSELQSLMRNSYAVFCLKNKMTQYYSTSSTSLLF